MNIAFDVIDIAAIGPLLILLGGALLLLLLESFDSAVAKRFSLPLTLTVLLTALAANLLAPVSENILLTSWLALDRLTYLFTLFFLTMGIAAALLAAPFFQTFQPSRGEYYFLLLAALFGFLLIGASADFLTLFLGIETLSIALYVLCGYMKRWKGSSEAATKYFLMGSVATAFFLYGIALIYGAVGTTRFDALLPAYHHLSTRSQNLLFLSGISLVTLGLAFKAVIAPFHFWAPDVYEGAPTPVTAFMAVGTKAGAFAAFVRLFFGALPHFDPFWSQAMAFLAILTLLYANFMALRQNQLRRFFAYSGMSHAGFLLIPLVIGSEEALQSLLFYLAVYVVATLGAFAVLACLDKQEKGVLFDDLSGLFSRRPLLAGLFALCLLTLGGIPPTAGFLAKFFVLKVAFQAGYFVLVVFGLLTTVLSASYYLRLIAALFAEAKPEQEAAGYFWSAAVVGGVVCGVILLLSAYPESLLAFL
jgi:NADH-quinone oxidoreductase subunit N